MRDVTIATPDDAYSAAVNRAEQQGFASTEGYLADLVVHSVDDDIDDFSQIFTPEILADIDSAALEARRGQCITVDELRENLKKQRTEWLEEHPA